MKVKDNFKTAIERQVAEAVSIAREKIAGKKLMNSRSEYNRCKIPRINTKENNSEEEIEREEEDRVNSLLRDLRIKKR